MTNASLVAERQLNWADRFLNWLLGGKLAPREPVWEDFITINRDGSVHFDYAGWWLTEPGERDMKAKMDSFKEFERQCRARDPNGEFTFYD